MDRRATVPFFFKKLYFIAHIKLRMVLDFKPNLGIHFVKILLKIPEGGRPCPLNIFGWNCRYTVRKP